jgi:PPM family protein phosphatase
MFLPIPASPSRVTSFALHPTPVPPDADPHVVVRLYGATDVGHTREHNEDTFLVADLEAGSVVSFEHGSETCVEGMHGLLFMVADGMGGAAAGEIASAMAAQVVYDELRTHWRAVAEPSPEGFATALRDATETANARIHAFARQHPEHRGMGTTATAVGLLGDSVYIAQVGDSRAYLMRDNKLILLTRDQSLMQRLVDAGEISEEQAEQSDRRNIILQALGPEPAVKIDLTHQQIRLGDTLIVCSDGLSGVAKARDIEEAARAEHDPAVLAHALIARANELGGPDNITVVVARFEGAGLRTANGGESVGRTVYPLRGTLADDERTPSRGAPALVEPAGSPSSPLLTPPSAAARPERVPVAPNPSAPNEGAAHDRKERARPVMLLLVLLGLAAAAWLLYKLFWPTAP